MFTSNFKNKKFLSLFFVICLIFLPFFSNLKILADGAAASAGETNNKRDLAQYIRDKNAGILYIGPIKYVQFQDNNGKIGKPGDGVISSVLSKILTDNNLKFEEDCFLDPNYENKTIKIKLTSTGIGKGFQGEANLTFSNDLERLQINDNTIKLTKEQFDNIKNNQKYESLIQAIQKTNPSLLIDSNGNDLEINWDSDKVVTIKGKEIDTPTGGKKITDFVNSRTIKLEVSNPQTTTSNTTNDDNSISWLVWSIIIIFVAVMGVIAFRIFKNKR